MPYSGVNMALMPDYWNYYGTPNINSGGGAPWATVDSTVKAPSGANSIKINANVSDPELELVGPAGSYSGGGSETGHLVDQNSVDHIYAGGFISCNVGDHIYFGCYIKTSTVSGYGPSNTNQGGEIGADAWITSGDTGLVPTGAEPYSDYIVPWGTSAWTWVEWDFIVQANYNSYGGVSTPFAGEIAPWLYLGPFPIVGDVWFGDAVLYINPSGSPSGSYIITATADANSSISPSGAVNVTSGTNQTFTYTANPDYTITQVLVDGSSVPITGSYTFPSVSANHTISVSTASSGLITPSVVQSGSASAGSGATSISPSAMGTTPLTGHVIMLTYTESSGDTPVAGDYGISSITQSGVTWTKAPGCLDDTANGMVAQVWYGVVGSSPSTSMTINLANALPSTGAAVVNWAEYNVSLVFPEPGNAVDQSALAAYNTTGQSPTFTGTTNAITAPNELIIGVVGSHSGYDQVTPQNGFALIGGAATTVGSNICANAMLWRSSDSTLEGSQFYSGTLFSDAGGHDFWGSIVTLPIEGLPVTLTVNSASHGSTYPAAGTWGEDLGDVVTITATPASGYQLTSWTINGVSNASTANPLLLTMTSNMTVTPVFSAIPNETLTVTAGSHGSVSPGTASYAQGTQVTETATPSTGYYLDHWLKDGATTIPASGNTIIIIMDTAHSIQPFFSLSPQAAGRGKSSTGTVQRGLHSLMQRLTRRA